jgi:hypothetical protein
MRDNMVRIRPSNTKEFLALRNLVMDLITLHLNGTAVFNCHMIVAGLSTQYKIEIDWHDASECLDSLSNDGFLGIHGIGSDGVMFYTVIPS